MICESSSKIDPEMPPFMASLKTLPEPKEWFIITITNIDPYCEKNLEPACS